MKKIAYIIIFTCYTIIFICFCIVSINNKPKHTTIKNIQEITEIAENQREYVKRNNLSSNYCFIVNYGIPSGQPRVFVYDFNKSEIIYKAHTMHGSGKGSTNKTPVLSNEYGSKCSTLGHFAITRQHGKINKTGFRLKGLDKANSNAYKRALMLHSSPWVDIYKCRKYIPINSRHCQGCITTSTQELKDLSKFVLKEKKMILLVSVHFY